MYDFFIAYATPDRRQAQELCWLLEDDSCKVFLDEQDLRLGTLWQPTLREALEASRAIVVLVSTHADDAFYQQEEIARAIQLTRDKARAHTVIPVILEKLPQGAVSMPYGMSSLQARDATRSGGLKRVAAELVAWLKEHQLNAKQPKVADAAIEASDRMMKLGPNPEKVIDVFRQSQPGDLLDSEKILADKELNGWSFLAIQDDIRNARTDIVVSSDDNHFRAEGGVSQCILQKVGQDVRRQLDYFKAQGFRQGQVVITTGGDWNRRAVIHAVVYDIEDYRFPTAELVRTLTRRILESAVALGARSIALPILGSGHARGPVKSSDLVHAIASETLAFMNGRNCVLKRVALYMLNRNDASGLPEEIKEPGDR